MAGNRPGRGESWPCRSGAHLCGKINPDTGVVVDEERNEIRVDGRPVHLTPTEQRLLRALVGRKGEVLSRTDLINAAAHDDTDVTERTVDVHVQAIRKKLGTYRNIIGTVRGAGYRYEG